MQVIIVDDDPVSRQILKGILRKSGYEVIEMPDGQAAWEYLQKEPARLVITDWIMPRMDGLELIQKIRAAQSPNYVYILILTGKDDKSDVVDGLNAGADDYLTKPFHINELRARVKIGERILDLESNLKNARDQMEEMAMHDSVTGLWNRRAIYIHTEAEFNRARRDSASVSLMLIDIDHFKEINDQYGHINGDRALQYVAENIGMNVRSYDWAGRWGGDEFLVILPGTSEQEAVVIANRIRENIDSSQVQLSSGEKVPLQVSIGVIDWDLGHSFALDTAIQMVDEALYTAKKSGRNRVFAR